ncbi:MAG: hypothetical protein WBL70_12570 [Candidatus Acidiferrales bacterium]
MNESLLDRSYAALLAGARKVSTSDLYNENGYAPKWEDNLMNGLPLAEIKRDFENGAGQELEGKLRAAHSSAALAVNAFGPWRTAAASLHFAGKSGFRSLQFEATCPTGLGGTPPHLDLLAEADLPVAVESKCTEWMKPKEAKFARSYDTLRPCHGHSPWFKQMQQLRKAPDRYRFLDAAQLIKHAFGLMSRYGTQPVRLVYLYWEPRNEGDWSECGKHRAEAADLSAKVNGASVQLTPMSYRDLWAERERHGSPKHMQYLRTRYDLEA